jgi:hypothetical protein
MDEDAGSASVTAGDEGVPSQGVSEATKQEFTACVHKCVYPSRLPTCPIVEYEAAMSVLAFNKISKALECCERGKG